MFRTLLLMACTVPALAAPTLTITDTDGVEYRVPLEVVDPPVVEPEPPIVVAPPRTDVGFLTCDMADIELCETFDAPESVASARDGYHTRPRWCDGAVCFDVEAGVGSTNPSGDMLFRMDRGAAPGLTATVQFDHWTPIQARTGDGMGADFKFLSIFKHAACDPTAVTMQSSYQSLPGVYRSCSGSTLMQPHGNDWLWQNGPLTTFESSGYHNALTKTSDDDAYFTSYLRESRDLDTSQALHIPGDTWVTYQLKVTVGEWNTPSSTVELLAALPGEELRHVRYIREVTIPNSTADGEMKVVQLFNYMTHRGGAKFPYTEHGLATFKYDNLIVQVEKTPAGFGGEFPDGHLSERNR